jgi:exodeoxyribonuclease VII large subunit
VAAAAPRTDPPARQVWTVSGLTALVKGTLEAGFGGLWVEGEISNLRVVSSGHVYFTLKDEGAQIRAVLFRGRTRRLRFDPADGLHVLAFGNLDVYAARGEYQLVCEVLEPKGLGALQLAFDQLRMRLAAEGLFDEARKRPLPALPRRVGLITSPTGAAVRDFLRVATRRFSGIQVLVCPVRVQGETAAAEIAEALAELNRRGDLDVLVLARGGGSLEDLWAFNEEAVARAVAASKIPVISAVGHETDVTIADFVADLRAPTPSAAAELVVREKARLAADLTALGQRLERALRQRVDRLAERVADLGRRRVLADPSRTLRDQIRRVDELGVRLARTAQRRHAEATERLTRAGRTLRPALLATRLRHDRRGLAELSRRLAGVASGSVERRGRAIEALAGRLDSLSPLACLARGYAVCQSTSGDVVRRATDVAAGEAVKVRLGVGRLDCRVEGVHADEPTGAAAPGGTPSDG